MTPHSHEYFMYHALREAQNAYDAEEVPVGAVVVINDKIISRAYNQTELLKDPTAHAEMLAITAACHFIGAKYLPGATLYVTVEPCLMCCGALFWTKLSGIVYGAADEKNGYRRVAKTVSPFHPKTKITAGILDEECARLMTDFFRERRR